MSVHTLHTDEEIDPEHLGHATSEVLGEHIFPPRTIVDDQPIEGNTEDVLSQPSITPPTGPARVVLTPIDPEEDDVDKQLQELEAWHERATKLRRLALLKEARAKYNAGDEFALQLADAGTSRPIPPQANPTAGLPRPEPPQTFSKRNRVEYNRWKRDCERYFQRLPQSFRTDAPKIDFAGQYLSESMKSLWEAHVADQSRLALKYEPTWETMKAVMLGTLGTLSERRQRAFDSITKARMRSDSSPTDLLDYMRPFWEELGSTHGADLQVMEYIHALPDDIQKQLFIYPENRRRTITQVEEAANTIFRQRPRQRDASDKKPQKDHRGDKDTSYKGRGKGRYQKKSKSATSGHYGSKRPKDTDGTPVDPAIRCWRCNGHGHYASSCTKPQKPSNGGKSSEAGKDDAKK